MSNDPLLSGEASCPLCQTVLRPELCQGQFIWRCRCNQQAQPRRWLDVGLELPNREAPDDVAGSWKEAG